jgi:coatomer subunit beta
MQTILAAETDATCKRNAFIFLARCDMDKAVEWINSVSDSMSGLDEGLQMAMIEVTRLDCKRDPSHRVSLSSRASPRTLTESK